MNSNLSQNGDEGLEGLANSDITLTNVSANNNAEFGILLANFGFELPLSPEPSNAPDRQYPPLPFSGNITLNQVTANSNGLGGAILESLNDINISNGQFNGNGADAIPYCEAGECVYDVLDGGIGLAAGSWIGQINLENVQASNNYGHGAILLSDNVVVRNSAFNNNGQGLPYLGGDLLWADGLGIEDVFGSSVHIECTRANNNAAFGIEIYTGDITLNNVTATGNGWDDFYFESDTMTVIDEACREVKVVLDLPWQIVPITGGESVGLNCSAYIGTILVLPNGDEIRLPCPTLGDASLTPVSENGLPGNLSEGNNFVSSFTAQVIKDGINLEPLPASMIVSFVIPEDMLDADLSILYWNGTEWAEVPGAYKTADGRFEASVNFTGTFILISK
jgi:hypothetical protein